MPGFGIESPRDLLRKLEQEMEDFEASSHLSERHALNAVWTAYHIYEWVWGDLLKGNYALQQGLGLCPSGTTASKEDFLAYLDSNCPAFVDAQTLTNAAKHFIRAGKKSGLHSGAFSSAFSRDFDISYLWIERQSGRRQNAEDFHQELVDFWRSFLNRHSP